MKDRQTSVIFTILFIAYLLLACSGFGYLAWTYVCDPVLDAYDAGNPTAIVGLPVGIALFLAAILVFAMATK